MKVLILENSTLIQKIVISNLTKLGIKDVYHTKHCDEALTYTKHNSDIKLFFIDHLATKINGLHFLDKLREQHPTNEFKNFKLICVSANAKCEYISKQYRDRGVFDFIHKPFSREDFNKIIVPLIDKECKSNKNIKNTISKKNLEELITGAKVAGKDIDISGEDLKITLGRSSLSIELDTFLRNAHLEG